MTASSRRPAAKKRKVSVSGDGSEPPPKKKSPLFNQPQNYYAPPAVSSMSTEELSEWRKEQRRKRNRESAAASRNKTRARIEELEGEADRWRRMYQEMEERVRRMEGHVRFLTELNKDGGRPRTVSAPDLQALPRPAAVVSHPNIVPSPVTSFLAPPPTYSSHIAASGGIPDLAPAEALSSNEVKAPEQVRVGKPFSANDEDAGLDGYILPDPSSNVEEGGGVEGIASGGAPDAAPAEALSSNEVEACQRARVAYPFSADDEDAGLDGYVLPDPSSDAGLLDLLGDTLDGEFDPNLFI